MKADESAARLYYESFFKAVLKDSFWEGAFKKKKFKDEIWGKVEYEFSEVELQVGDNKMKDDIRGRTIIFDLDGTLADCRHRRHLVEGKNKDWDKFYQECVNDVPFYHMQPIVVGLWHQEFKIHIWSGRSDVVLYETKGWLLRKGFPYNILKMRKEGDYTPDETLKQKWLQDFILEAGEKPLMVFDDRQKVVDMWRRNGIPCLQVAEGNF